MLKTSLIFYGLMCFSFSSFSQWAIRDSTEVKRLTSASIAILDSKDFNQGVIHSPYQLFNGRMTGLGMSAIGNDPNGEYLIRVRGLSTLQNETSPLLVVDGFITDNLLIVDPADIAQITVLKDAAAASTYGVQGGNGVILISTKKGKDQPASVSFNTTFGVDQPIDNITPASASEYKSYPGSTDMGSSQNWLDLITQTGLSSVNNLNFSEGSKSFSMRASINYRKASGTLIGTGFNQFNSRINIQQKALKDKLLMQLTLASTSRKSDYGFRESIKYAFNANPTMPVFNPASTPHGGYSQNFQYEVFNPVAIIEQNTNSGNERTSTIGLNGDYQFDNRLRGFGIQFSYQFQDQSNFYGRYFSKNSYYIGEGRNGLASRNSQNQNAQQLATSLNFKKKLKYIDIQISSGYQQQNYFKNSMSMEGGDFLTDAFGFNNMAASLDVQNGIGKVSSSADSYKVASWLSTASISFEDKYFLNATSNYSGSTRFGKNNKWGLFPSLGGGIKWQESLSLFSSLTARASWGKAGNIPQQSNLSRSLLSPGGYMHYNASYVPSYYLTRDANPDLKWEEKSEINIGADFTFLNERISGSLDFFNNKVTDLISQVYVPSPPYYSYSMFANLGELQNHGVEINLNFAAIAKSEFVWGFNFNLSRVTSKVNSLNGNGFSLGQDGRMTIGVLPDAGGCSSHGVNLIEEGAPLGQIQGPVFTGIDPNGSPSHKDLNGDGIYCDCQDDFKVLANALPKFTFGWGNRLLYKNFEMGFLLRGASGHKKVNSYRLSHEASEVVSYYNLVKTPSFDPKLRYTHLSDRYIENAGFVILDNISLMYHVPTALKITITVTAQNLFTLTKYTGMDPEVAYGNPILKGQTTYPINQSPLISGIESRGTYLPSRIFSLGMNVKF